MFTVFRAGAGAPEGGAEVCAQLNTEAGVQQLPGIHWDSGLLPRSVQGGEWVESIVLTLFPGS